MLFFMFYVGVMWEWREFGIIIGVGAAKGNWLLYSTAMNRESGNDFSFVLVGSVFDRMIGDRIIFFFWDGLGADFYSC